MERSRALESVKAFLKNDKEIEKIIIGCDLYPVKESWRKWTDYLGNYLQIYNNKRVVSIENSSKGKNPRIVTDLYFKSHPKIISKISKWAFISFGRDNKDKFNICFIWFLGQDERLRLISLHNNIWQRNNPPLVSGVDTLRPIINYMNVDNYYKADILRIKGPLAADMKQSWATVWPPKNEFIKEISNISEELSTTIKGIMSTTLT